MSDETATVGVHVDKPMQDVLGDLEGKLFPEAQDELEARQDEPEDIDEEEEAFDDDDPENEDDLPEDDDPDSDYDDDGEDLDEDDEDDDYTLASLLGIDDSRIVETEDGLFFNAIIDGETKQVPIEELVADYQIRGHVNNKSVALETERQEFEKVRAEVASELKSRAEGLQALGKLMEEQLIGEYNAIDWERLRAEDPAQWAALRQEYSERAQKVKQAQELAGEETNRLMEEQQNDYNEKFNNHMNLEIEKMVAANPTWADEAKFQEEFGAIKSFLKDTYGYQDEEIRISDHRLVKVFQDAMAFRKGKEAAQSKRVKRKVPKFQKPGVNRGNAKSLAKARRVKAQRSKVKAGGGKINDVASLIEERM